MSYLVDISYIHFPTKDWQKDARAIGTMIAATAESGLSVELKFHTDSRSKCRPIPSLSALVKQSPKWGKGGHVLASEPGVDPPDALDLSVLSDRVRLMLVMPDETAGQ